MSATAAEQSVLAAAVEVYRASQARDADAEDEPRGNRPVVTGTNDARGRARFERWLNGSRRKCLERVTTAEIRLWRATQYYLAESGAPETAKDQPVARVKKDG